MMWPEMMWPEMMWPELVWPGQASPGMLNPGPLAPGYRPRRAPETGFRHTRHSSTGPYCMNAAAMS
jgi:hypothetical protein